MADAAGHDCGGAARGAVAVICMLLFAGVGPHRSGALTLGSAALATAALATAALAAVPLLARSHGEPRPAPQGGHGDRRRHH